MTTMAKPCATIADLYDVPESRRAELVNGEIVLMPFDGAMTGEAEGSILVSLRAYRKQAVQGRVLTGRVAFIVDLPNRQSFSPDVAWYTGNERFLTFPKGAPVFAAEVRCLEDYGQAAEREMRDKRHDYFAAGTLVVWDVDLLSPDVVRKYRAGDPDTPTVFRHGDLADAEPAVPGWQMPVDDLFEPEE